MIAQPCGHRVRAPADAWRMLMLLRALRQLERAAGRCNRPGLVSPAVASGAHIGRFSVQCAGRCRIGSDGRCWRMRCCWGIGAAVGGRNARRCGDADEKGRARGTGAACRVTSCDVSDADAPAGVGSGPTAASNNAMVCSGRFCGRRRDGPARCRNESAKGRTKGHDQSWIRLTAFLREGRSPGPDQVQHDGQAARSSMSPGGIQRPPETRSTPGSRPERRHEGLRP